MLEWLVTIGAAELGKAIFEQVLKLGQAAAEDYVKDFFKGCLKGGITAAKPEVTKKAVAEALKAFLLIVTDELEDQDLSKAEIRDRYDPALVQFIQNSSVKPILGKAFEKDCKAIETTALATLWQACTLRGKPFPTLPEKFDWQRVGGEYLKKVRRIIRETPELRSLLEMEFLEDIARNTIQFSPGFDVASYRKSLQCSYGHLKLYAIDSTDRGDSINLWTMFIEQTVREALPPMRYELPLDLKRRLLEQGELESDLSPEALEHYRQNYFQQPLRKVLDAVTNSQWAVILGDPGAGKSTLLQYLALDWVEGKAESLPLLIELREYANSQSHNFLDFLHRGRGVDWQFDQQQLHQYLQDHPTLVMFDGLDKVFDRTTQSTIIDDVIRFAHQYPKAQILITSRIIGYNPERLQHSQFRHFTIQPLDTDEIHEFIDRWYDLSLGSDPDKIRLKQRLKDAIANSKAIQNLADNPLLLTMMAILNRRQELPRDRADLYDQASRVLLYHWDVDHKRLQLPMDAIGRREKQEMLRAIAYEMQAGEEGLKGNLISADRLTRILTDYLRDQGFSAPREKANLLIQQLRERNFILCYRGADTYGFMHRTFLEYFCAVEIVHRFEKQRTLTFEQLRDEIFGNHWQDETWHEVLRLICGAIDPKFAENLIQFLININEEDFKNIFMAAECFLEVSNKEIIKNTSDQLQTRLSQLVEYGENSEVEDIFGYFADLKYESFHRIHIFERHYTIILVRCAVIELIGQIWKNDESTFKWLKECTDSNSNWVATCSAIKQLVRGWKDKPETFSIIKNLASLDIESAFSNVQEVAIRELAQNWHNSQETLEILKKIAICNKNFRGRWNALKELSRCCENQSEDLTTFLFDRAVNDPFVPLHYSNRNPRQAALITILDCYAEHPYTLAFLMNRAENDSDGRVRSFILSKLPIYWKGDSFAFNFLCQRAVLDPHQVDKIKRPNPRQASLEALLTHYPTHPKTVELLRDRATNDPDEQLREWAQEQLQKMENQGESS